MAQCGMWRRVQEKLTDFEKGCYQEDKDCV